VSRIGVLDASAVLAYLHREPGRDRVEAALDESPCWITAVNACEVLGKLCERGLPLAEARAAAIDELRLTVRAFDLELALIAAALKVRTRPIGASLGDRACLALAEYAARSGNTPTVYTAEQVWGKLEWPFQVVLIR